MKTTPIDQIVCVNCFNIVDGPLKTPDASFYRLNNNIYCSLGCFKEDEENKLKDSKIKNSHSTNKNNKSKNKVHKKRSKPKKRSRK